MGATLAADFGEKKMRNRDGKLTRFSMGRCFMFINMLTTPLQRTTKLVASQPDLITSVL